MEESIMKCQYCGFEIEDDYLFCGWCGKKIEKALTILPKDNGNDEETIQEEDPFDVQDCFDTNIEKLQNKDISEEDDYIDYICPYCQKLVSYAKWQVAQKESQCPWCDGIIIFNNTIGD